MYWWIELWITSRIIHYSGMHVKHSIIQYSGMYVKFSIEYLGTYYNCLVDKDSSILLCKLYMSVDTLVGTIAYSDGA